jgi:AcrR family transcriptional regulator
MYERGIRGTSIDDILAASGAGKSQFYHYFPDKSALVVEVLGYQVNQILDEQSQLRLDSYSGIAIWFERLVELHEARGLRGCPLGSLAGEATAHGEHLRRTAAAAFGRWESSVTAALEAMLERGELVDSVDPAELAEAVIAIIQGGYLFSSIKGGVRPMRAALGVALRHLDSYRSTGGDA